MSGFLLKFVFEEGVKGVVMIFNVWGRKDEGLVMGDFNIRVLEIL